MDKILAEACLKLGVAINGGQISQFLKYMELLISWNEKINLTAITEPEEILLKHFADSVSLIPFTDVKNKNIIDVGTGAGFPGIPVKIAEPSAKVTLIDSLNKRVNFLREVVSEISLTDVECIHSRAEEGGKNPKLRERFDVCVSRAVANLSVLSEYCLPFIKVGGVFVSLKGPDAQSEINEAEKAIDILGGEISFVEKVEIPFTDIVHSLVMIKKVRQTPGIYPRKPGKISKNPIK
ncbi:MAG: 16S rRNA (guanine(527)-N(7))-methyltransferase RsmG [Clostridiales bacterium]|jgi:16S rRNA (guanine527-N7)-methyltransferase|nr:16S rRNA (guanine(527)-N(7))-methyltransferase RsmG [Clostridiales bacterium]